MADGSIMIETKLSTDKFDKQVADLEKKIRIEEEKTKLKLDAKLQAENELKRHKQAVYEIEKEYAKTTQEVEHLNNIMSKQSKGISLSPQEMLDLQSSKEVIALNEKQGAQLDKMYAKQIKLNNQVDKTSLAYKQVQDNVQGYKSKIEDIKLQKQQAQVNELKGGFDKVVNSIGSVIGKIGRMVIGIFSVASAYRLMSSASSTLGQYDEQYATNLEYIRYLIAQAIAPALKYVVNLASTLLGYLNYILNAWFGITLASKNSAKNFINAKASTSGISKNTGKIKKDLQTTSFDEMNVLADTSSSTSGGGTSAGGGVVAPSIDPTAVEIPEWLKKFTEFTKPVINFFKEILDKYGLVKGGILIVIGALAGFYIIKSLIKLFTSFGKSIGGISADFTGFLNDLR